MSLRKSWVRLAEGGFTHPPEATKTETSRFVPLEGLGREVVSRRLEKARFSKCDFLLPSRDGEGPAGFPWTAWRSVLRRSGIADFRPHDLRHTHGSYLAMLGKSIPEIMAALGHKTPAVALRYVHLASGHQRQVSAEVNARLGEWVNLPH